MSGDTIGSRPSSSGRDTSKPQPQTPTQVFSTTPSKSGSTGTGKSTRRDRKGRDKELEKALEREKTQTLGKANRAKLLRAWVEISAWFVDWKRRNGEPFCSIFALDFGQGCFPDDPFLFYFPVSFSSHHLILASLHSISILNHNAKTKPKLSQPFHHHTILTIYILLLILEEKLALAEVLVLERCIRAGWEHMWINVSGSAFFWHLI